MKAINRLREQLEKIGATLDDDSDYTLYCEAPIGYVWAESGSATMAIQIANNSQSWIVAAIKKAIPDLQQGLRLADADESEDIGEMRDENWIAPAGSPERIEWVG